MEPFATQSDLSSQPLDFGVQFNLCIMSYDANLQTWCNEYVPTAETPIVDKRKYTTPMDDTLHLPRPPTDKISKVPKFPLHYILDNPNSCVAPNYIVVDDLAQSPDTMLTLEVLRNFPLQCKY